MKKKRLIVTTLLASSLFAFSKLVLGNKATEASLANQDIVHQLGWFYSAESPSLCRGYYQEPELNALLPTQLAPGQLMINADYGSYLLSGVSKVKGHVVIAEPGKRITADEAVISTINPKQKTIDLEGHVVMREPGNLVIAKHAHYVWEKSQGELRDVLYRWSLGMPAYALTADQKQRLLYGLMGWGKAQRGEQHAKDQFTLYNTSFSTCTPPSTVWQLTTTKLELDRELGRGVARNMVLRVKDIPVLYTPYFSFPLDKRRKSGFLFGTYGYSNKSGFDINLPYYWNLAPNYDAILTPRLIEKRGIQYNGLFRYLTATSQGDIDLEYLPGDKDFQRFQAKATRNYPATPLLTDLVNASANRYLFHWRNSTHFNDAWSSKIDFTQISDDYYFQDLTANPNTINENQVLQQAELHYAGDQWNFLGRLQKIQTLHPINRAYLPDQYSRLPQLLFTSNYPKTDWGLNYSLSAEFVHFDKPRDPLTRVIYPTGNRFDFKPGLSWPLQREWGYLIPGAQLALTHYDIADPAFNKPNSINRVLPIFTIDSGLYFTRQTALFHDQYEQTLEPRAYYFYVPYRNQDDIPIFDSTWIPLTFSQLFSTNRYAGIDRIGDANQVSLGLTTRLIDKVSGIEKVKASIGQIYYFQNRQVTLNDPLLPVQNQLGALSLVSKVSPVVGEVNYYIANNWHFIATGGYDTAENEVYSTGANFQYNPRPGQIFNLGYNFIRKGDVLPNNQLADLNLSDVSIAWPLANRQWKVVGRWNYNLRQSHMQNVFSGLEYNTCCWAIRFLANKSFIAFNQINNPEYNTGFYIQIQLKGLGNFSTNDPSGIIMSGIPGYQDNFGEL